MKYAVPDDLIAEMPLERLADYIAEDDDHNVMVSGGGIPPDPLAHMQRAIDDASELINSYIKVRYPSLDTVPPVLRKACVRIALSYIVDRKFTGNTEISQWASGIRTEQIRLLEQISKGIINLGLDELIKETSEVKIKVSPKKVRLGDIFEN